MRPCHTFPALALLPAAAPLPAEAQGPVRPLERLKQEFVDQRFGMFLHSAPAAFKPLFTVAAAALVAGLFLGMAGRAFGQASDPGLHIEGRFLMDGNGQKVVFRGPELVYRWGVYSGITDMGVDVPWEGGRNNNVGSATIREIGKTKASAMRILGGKDDELEALLNTAIVEQKMYAAVARVDWKNPRMMAVLKKYGDYILLHPRGEFTHRNPTQWKTEAMRVIQEIRALGYTSVIELGTTGYGQTWSTIKNHGEEVAASDPLKKTMYLLQLYSEYAGDVKGTLDEVAAFPYPVSPGACLFTSTYGNTPNTYKEVWDETFKRDLSCFYWDWFGDGEGNSMTTNGMFTGLNAIGRYIVNESPAALKNTVKGAYILNAPDGKTTSIRSTSPSPRNRPEAGLSIFDLNGRAIPARLLPPTP